MRRREFISLLGAAAALRPRAAWEMLSSETVRTLVAGAVAVASDGGFALVGAMRAHAVSLEELNNPGPLPDMVLGSADAPITIIEYASLTCPA